MQVGTWELRREAAEGLDVLWDGYLRDEKERSIALIK